jgi:antitoxin ParD1/3/4
MNISLTPELEAMIQEKVRSGLYHTASEVVREALRLFQEREQLYAIRLEELRKEIAKGVEQLERGEGREVTAEEIKAMGRARLKGKR